MASAMDPAVPGDGERAVTPTRARDPRFPLVDGLRAVAMLCVVVTHTAALSGFNLVNGTLGPITARLDSGVTLFFVISGFLIYRPFVAARVDGRPAPRPGPYVRRRLLRVVPAYWLALTLLAVWPGLPGVHSGDWWIYYGFLQNLRVTTVASGIGPAWSLCVELSFYAALPLYALLVRRRWGSLTETPLVRRELAVLAALSAASMTVRMFAFDDSTPTVPVANTIAGTFVWFAAGMGLAVASVAYAGRAAEVLPLPLRIVARRPGLAWLAALGVIVVTSRLDFPRVIADPFTATEWFAEPLLYGAFALCLALPAVFGAGRRGVPARVLSWRPLAWLGLVSYGVFLWHLPLATELTGVTRSVTHLQYIAYFAVTLAAATACAAASYYGVERPLLALKGRAPRPPVVGRLEAARGTAD